MSSYADGILLFQDQRLCQKQIEANKCCQTPASSSVCAARILSITQLCYTFIKHRPILYYHFPLEPNSAFTLIPQRCKAVCIGLLFTVSLGKSEKSLGNHILFKTLVGSKYMRTKKGLFFFFF